MFKSKNKEKKEKIASDSSSSYKETTRVQTLNNGSATTFIRQTSSQASHSRTTEERSTTILHSSSTGSVPRLTAGPVRSNLQTDATPFTFGTPYRSPAPLGSSSRLPITSLSSTFGATATSNQPRSSLPYRSPAPYRSALSTNTFASYPSRTATSPYVAATPNEDIIPIYPNNCSKRGKALVINNIKFIEKKDERVGAEKDSQDLTSLLRMIGFEVDLKKNLKGKEMLEKVKQFSKSNFSSHDMSIVVIMSHGSNVQQGNTLVRVRGGFTEIAGVDNVPLLVDDIIDRFTASNGHPSLKGKPKIFMFQCCRGEKDQELCHDAVPITKPTKEHSDMLIAFSTLPGYLSNRNPKMGSWYIQSICEVFKKHYKTYHIEEMLKLVDNALSTKHPQYTQTSTYESRGFNKKCYLYPRSAT